MTPLPPGFLRHPVAHRGLHGPGVPENSLAAVRAAVAAGYGIEIDVQPSADGQAMVFHDATLDRMTEAQGPVRDRTAADLGRLTLRESDEPIPTLAQVLAAVDGQVPLVIEIKDQDGALGPDVGALEHSVAHALDGYTGPVAVMSFNPHSVAAMRDAAPDVPRGLTTCAFRAEDWDGVPPDRLRALARLEAVDPTGAAFVSHDARDLAAPRIAELKRAGLPILCWTIRSPEQAAQALTVADAITFEGFRPDLPPPVPEP